MWSQLWNVGRKRKMYQNFKWEEYGKVKKTLPLLGGVMVGEFFPTIVFCLFLNFLLWKCDLLYNNYKKKDGGWALESPRSLLNWKFYMLQGTFLSLDFFWPSTDKAEYIKGLLIAILFLACHCLRFLGLRFLSAWLWSFMKFVNAAMRLNIKIVMSADN